ncbi:hypothetical protein TSUD_236890 [Trifolium subterraneum]|uniref:Uncharacterized protein n=1 Tax=Trifolium subterraneum TaxID=3900 RepID=A0A2Z6PGC2_TRISU|nr:hypothetical protein TSUD_236890 [Trifolium subterraneum]
MFCIISWLCDGFQFFGSGWFRDKIGLVGSGIGRFKVMIGPVRFLKFNVWGLVVLMNLRLLSLMVGWNGYIVCCRKHFVWELMHRYYDLAGCVVWLTTQPMWGQIRNFLVKELIGPPFLRRSPPLRCLPLPSATMKSSSLLVFVDPL